MKFLTREEVSKALALLNCNAPGHAAVVWNVLDKHAIDIDTAAGALLCGEKNGSLELDEYILAFLF